MKELAIQNTRLDHRYDVLKLLGRGSYAEIFVARNNFAPPDSPDQLVVIKALNVFLQEAPDADLERTLIENFQNEAVALDRVRHPNVINRLGHGTARDLNNTIFHYLVLEYLPGGDLAEMCKGQPLSLSRTLFYLEQVCAGLAYAHANAVIHRDIKPNNLLLTEDKQILKIADFGVAKFANVDSPITRVGTNVYAAPEHSPLNAALEIAAGKEFRLTPAADVYSLAKTVYALLTGESPRKFANAPITSLPSWMAAESWANNLLAVLERATQSDVAVRTKTVEEFWQELRQTSNQFEEATRTVKREVASFATANLHAPNNNVPTRPAFNSFSNVQIAPPQIEQMPERPRIVIGINQEQRKPLATAAKTISGNKFSASNASDGASGNVTPVPDSSAPHTIKTNEQPIAQKKSFLALRLNAFLKGAALRLAVVLIILGTFVGILGGTYSFLQNQGYLPTSFPWLTTRQGVVNQDGYLRSTPGMRRDNIVGLVTKDSTLKIVGEDENWYQVEIVQQGQPEKVESKETKGWVGKIIVDVQ